MTSINPNYDLPFQAEFNYLVESLRKATKEGRESVSFETLLHSRQAFLRYERSSQESPVAATASANPQQPKAQIYQLAQQLASLAQQPQGQGPWGNPSAGWPERPSGSTWPTTAPGGASTPRLHASPSRSSMSGEGVALSTSFFDRLVSEVPRTGTS